MAAPSPTPGHPIRRSGKPYIHVRWLAKMLGGNQCRFSLWFRARFKYVKFEAEASDLAQWNRDHNAMMRDRRVELEENGWTVFTEEQNEFKLEGVTAIVGGKPDIVATVPGQALIVDGKTGRERDSDIWQVLIYLFAFPKCRLDIVGKFAGEVHYKRGDRRVPVPLASLTRQRLDDIVKTIKIVDSPTPPPKSPSREECRRCNIGVADCPQRFQERTTQQTATTAF